jgi:ribonucleoside-diphosphate reductase alpha chain/ribonucleoside-triphosphate reductase
MAASDATLVKRDGTRVPFDDGKVCASVRRALEAADASSSASASLAERAAAVTAAVARGVGAGAEAAEAVEAVEAVEVGVEAVQDVVERSLMATGEYAAAKLYILYRERRAERRRLHGLAIKVEADGLPAATTPWGEIGYVTFKRTYARVLGEGGSGSGGGSGGASAGAGKVGRTEEFEDTVRRVLEACQTQLGVGFTSAELSRARGYLLRLKGSVAGRFMWQLGSATVARLGLASLQNCAFTAIDEPVRPFVWIFDFLMLGSGCGFSVQRQHVGKLPPLLDADVQVSRRDTKDADFIVPDSREGWVALLERVLEAYFSRGRSFTYSTVLIRGSGSRIAGFGGVANGPESLCSGVADICGVLRRRRGQRLGSVDCLDLVNIVAAIVVSGNVRRSALLAIGDADDLEFLRAKRWDLGGVPNWRAMSNNSVACDDVAQLPDEFWEGYRGNGEPYGLINLRLARAVGRLADGDRYPDPDVVGFNPCAEQGLAKYETCCLAEIFLPNVESADECADIATLLYRICKHSLLLPCHAPETQAAVHRNMRMGLGVTGYLQATEAQRAWLPAVYERLRAFDAEYSARVGCPRSVKLTTCKPSGTLSLLAGVTPGVHPAIFQHFIRRVRMAAGSRLAELCRARGYLCEFQRRFDGSLDKSTTVVEFPCCYPEGVALARDTDAVRQLEHVRRMQTDWSDNSVSVTVYYRLEELPAIRAWLAQNYATCVKTVSFLLHSDHGFAQAPYEEISEEEYRRLKAGVRPIVGGLEDEEDDAELLLDLGAECASGACPVK